MDDDTEVTGERVGGQASDRETAHETTRSDRSGDERATGGERVDDLEDRLAELEAAVQALRGYAGSVRSVNEGVRERADAAAAAVEDIEDRLADHDERIEALEDADDRARALDAGRAEAAERADGGAESTPRTDAAGTADHEGPSAERCPTCERPQRDARFTPDVGKRSTDSEGAASEPRGDAGGTPRGAGDRRRAATEGSRNHPSTDESDGADDRADEPEWLASATDRLDDAPTRTDGRGAPSGPSEDGDDDGGPLAGLRSLL